jgi:hypothetical protein
MQKSSVKWPDRLSDYNLATLSKLPVNYFKAELLNHFMPDL